VRGVQHVRRCRAGRQQLFDLGDVARLHDGADGDQHRRAPHPGAISLGERRGIGRVAHGDGLDQLLAIGEARLAADDDEAPGLQPPVIGRPQAGIEDQVEVGARGRRLLQLAHRTAGQQLVEGEQARLARMGDVRHVTISI
jgi:hypothetical protein